MSSPMAREVVERVTTGTPPISVAIQVEPRMAGGGGAAGSSELAAGSLCWPTKLVTMSTGSAGARGFTK